MRSPAAPTGTSRSSASRVPRLAAEIRCTARTGRMPRSASAEVIEEGDLIVISGEIFGDMIKANPEIAVRMLRKQSIRLRETNKQLEQALKTAGAQATGAVPVQPAPAAAGTSGTLQAEAKSVKTGEIQLTNGMKRLLKTRPIYACEIDGVRHDTGNKLGFLKAVVYFGLKRPDLAEPFREYLKSLPLD